MNASAATFASRIAAARIAAVRLDVSRLSIDLSTIIPVQPADVATFPSAKHESIEDAATIASALDALEASRPEPDDTPIDARYALEFKNASGDVVLSAYKARRASVGQIDELLCSFEALRLHEWLIARYRRV